MQKLTRLPAAPLRAGQNGRTRGIPMNTLLLILSATLLGVVGQMVLKQGMTQMGPLSVSAEQVPQLVWRMATSPFVVIGLLIYGGGTFFWLIALSRVDLSYVYPFASLSYVLIFFASWALFHEQISLLRVAGMIVICMGVLLVARS
ncbi:MAG: EamA family transporter [Chloroflexales bacterium]|nr:EamA family transporter [Chloroflexales bacterium]